MLTKKTKNVFIFSILFVTASAAVTTFVMYVIVNEGAKLATQSETVLKNNLLQQQYLELQKSLEATDEDRIRLKSHLLTENETVRFLSEIESIARLNAVSLTTNSLDVSDKKEGGFNTLTIKFSVQGTESGMQNILKTFESLPYHGQVTELQLTRRENVGGGATLAGSITLTLSLRSYD